MTARNTATRRSSRTQTRYRAVFVVFDQYIETNTPEPEGNQSRSNSEVFEDQLTDGSLVSLHSPPRPYTLHHRDVPLATRLCHALNARPSEDEYHLLVHSQILYTRVFVAQRHFQTVLRPAGARVQRPSSSGSLPPPRSSRRAAACRTQGGRLQKHLNSRLVGYFTPQLGETTSSSRRSPSTQRPTSSGRNHQAKEFKNPCLISSILFGLSFGDGLIHEQLSVRLSFSTNDMQKICSNSGSRSSPTASCTSRSPPSASQLPTTTRATRRRTSRLHQHLLPPPQLHVQSEEVPHCPRCLQARGL